MCVVREEGRTLCVTSVGSARKIGGGAQDTLECTGLCQPLSYQLALRYISSGKRVEHFANAVLCCEMSSLISR